MDKIIKKQLEEMFAIHLNLKLVDTVDGDKLFSSPSMKQNFLLSIKQTSRTKPIYNEIKSLVNKGLVVPCFKHKGFFSNLKYQFFYDRNEKMIAGFFHPEKKKVYVLVDNEMNKFGFASNDLLASTTIHECMHLFSNINKTKFNSIFMSDLRKFYFEVFDEIFKLKSKPKGLDNIIKFINRFETLSNFNINKELTNYYNLLLNNLKEYSKLDENDFMLQLTNYIVPIKIFFLSFSAFMNSYNKYQSIFIAISHAYQKAFGNKNNITAEFQELISTSEPICVLSEMDPRNSKIIQAFKKFS